MKKIYDRLRVELGHKPSVGGFDAFLATLAPEAGERWKMDVCRLGYGYYMEMSDPYKEFARKYMEHDRECERRYIRDRTVRGGLLYTPLRPSLLLQMVNLVEFTNRESAPSSRQIASSLLMAFNYPDSVRGLAARLRKAGHSPEAILTLAGKREVTDEY